VRGFDPIQSCRCCSKRFEAQHRARSPLYAPVILFHDVVEVFRSINSDLSRRTNIPERGIHCVETSFVGAAFVDRTRARQPVRRNRFGQKTQSSCFIAMRGQHEIKGLAIAIYGAIQVAPFAAHFHIGLIEAPRRSSLHLTFLRGLGQSGCVFHDPTVQRRMINLDATLRQDFFQISIRDDITDVEKDRVQDDVSWKL